MSSVTPNINLLLTPADDTTTTFKEWRVGMNGEGNNSNMSKIDTKFGDIDSRLDDMINEHLAPPATITIGCTGSKHESVADYCCSADSAVFQAAINALPPSGGKIVILEGTYTINGGFGIPTIPVGKAVVLEGMGDGTILNFTNATQTDGCFISVFSSSLRIYNCRINVSSDGRNLINAFENSLVKLADCTIQYTLHKPSRCGNILYIADSPASAFITDCQIQLDNNAVVNTSLNTCNANILYDSTEFANTYIDRCHIECVGRTNGSYPKSAANVGEVARITNCSIKLGTCGSISQDMASIVTDIVSNCDIAVYGGGILSAKVFSNNIVQKIDTSGTVYFSDNAIIIGNHIRNRQANDFVVYNNSPATITGNRFTESCTLTSSPSAIKANNIPTTVNT